MSAPSSVLCNMSTTYFFIRDNHNRLTKHTKKHHNIVHPRKTFKIPFTIISKCLRFLGRLLHIFLYIMHVNGNVFYVFYILFSFTTPLDMWILSFLTGDGTHTSCIGILCVLYTFFLFFWPHHLTGGFLVS